MARSSPNGPALPGTYVSLLADAVARWDISPATLLDGSGVEPEQLLEPIWYLDFHVFDRLLTRAIKLTGEPGLGFHLGMQMTVSCHGIIGFAAMVARNLREAVQTAQQFALLRCPVLQLRLEESGEEAFIHIDQPRAEYRMGEAGIIFLLVGFSRMGEALTGCSLTGTIEVTFPKPDYADQYMHLVGGAMRFSAPANRVVFPRKHLDLPLMMTDPLAARLAREQCKRDLNGLLGSEVRFSKLVRELAYDEALGFSLMDEVAARLHVSERTLQRQLADEGETFTGLIEKIRQEKSLLMLKKKRLSTSLISEKLGYANVTNFTRAFKRWQGKTPSQYRLEIHTKENKNANKSDDQHSATGKQKRI